MSYSDQKYYSRPLGQLNTFTGTATASGTNAITGADIKTQPQNLPFPRKTLVNFIEITNQIAPAANWTALKLIAKNGTSTVGSVANVGTFTAGQTGTLTASNGTFTAGSALTWVFDGTGTASGQAIGTFVVGAETQELYT